MPVMSREHPRVETTREQFLGHLRTARDGVFAHYDKDRRILMENVGPTRRVDHSSPGGRLFNPGHSIEVAWFMLQASEVSEEFANLRQLGLDVILGSLEVGWDAKHGGILYMMDIAGRPLVDATVTKDGKLWWPHCEALIALVYAYTLTQRREYLDWLRRVHEYTYRTFVDRDLSKCGEWYGYANQDGSLLHTCKGGNYKGFFHVPRALLNCVQRVDVYLAGKRS